MRIAFASLAAAFILSGCFAFSHKEKPVAALDIPEGLIAVSVPFVPVPPKLHAGDRIDIFANLSGFNPFPPAESPEKIDATPVRLIGSSLVLAVSPAKQLTLALDHTEAHYLDLFKEHGNFLTSMISNPKELTPHEITEERPLLK